MLVQDTENVTKSDMMFRHVQVAHCTLMMSVLQETRNVTKCRESRTKLEETVEALRKSHMELLHSRDKCALEIKVS